MSNSARKLYDRVLESTSRPLDEISEILQLAMINFVSSVAGELISLFPPLSGPRLTLSRAFSLCEIDRLLPATSEYRLSSRSPHSNLRRRRSLERFDDSSQSLFSLLFSLPADPNAR